MTNFKGFHYLAFAATVVSTLCAETHCPGNVASVPFRLVKGHQIILPVSVNHAGPYNFLLDTGTQITHGRPVPRRAASSGHARRGHGRRGLVPPVGIPRGAGPARNRRSRRWPARRCWSMTCILSSPPI